MQAKFVEKRLQVVETTVSELGGVPDRMAHVEGRLEIVETQMMQLHTEMRGEFSAIRREMRRGDEETRSLTRVLIEEARVDIRKLAEGVDDARQRLSAVETRVDALAENVATLNGHTSALAREFGAFRTDIGARLDSISSQLARRQRRKPHG